MVGTTVRALERWRPIRAANIYRLPLEAPKGELNGLYRAKTGSDPETETWSFPRIYPAKSSLTSTGSSLIMDVRSACVQSRP